MKLIKTANGKKIKMSKSEWEGIGKTAGWMRTAGSSAEELIQKSIKWGEEVKANVENDGGQISDFRVRELAKAKFMSNVLLQVEMSLYYIQPDEVISEIEYVKGMAENGQTLTSQDLDNLLWRAKDLKNGYENLKKFVLDSRKR